MIKTRTIFIWDIHGCFDEFMALLKKLELKPEDKVYLTGDFITKWPKGLEVLEFLYNNQDQFKSITWNHEYDFIKYVDNNNSINDFYSKEDLVKVKERNIALYEKIKNREELIDFLRNLPKVIETPDFYLVHAWVINWDLNKPSLWIEEWLYKSDWFKDYKWNKKIIYWHYSIYWIKIIWNTIWIDSWCFFWGFLTAYILETWEIIQQKSFKAYKEYVFKPELL
jgi:bis(5'-nucleosyl)-tetraphosphatase (symmetrical)